MSGAAILSRRWLLRATLVAGGAAAGGVGAFFVLRGSAPAVPGLRILSAHEYRTLSALAHALFPPGGPVALSADDLDLARLFDGFLADEPPWNQGDLKSALFLLELGPVLYERRLKTFSHLPEAERLAHFNAWAESDSELRRQVAVALRKFTSLVFYDDPRAWPGIGYPGPALADGAGR